MTNTTDTGAHEQPALLTRHDLETMTPEEIVAAHESGDLAHLTVQSKPRHHGSTNEEKP